MRSKDAIPSSSHATASPSIMHERAFRAATASTINGIRWVGSLRGGLYNLTLLSFLRAMPGKPSCLFSCNHPSWGGGHRLEGGRHGFMKPAGSSRKCNDMRVKIEER